jgi:LemA protein
MNLALILSATVVTVWLVWTWNRLVALRAALLASWASVDVLLKRRADLVPQLVNVVKGAMDFEAGTLQQITEARSKALAAGDLAERARAEEQFGGTVRQLVAMVEAYPTLSANASALEFQKQLAETENDIAMARRYYNAVARDLNTLRQTFPTVLIAGTFGFEHAPYFELSDASEAAVPQAKLGRGE